MQVRWRKNPKTEEGWFKRIAISLLVGVAGFAVGFPGAFFLMVEYLKRTRPGDTENFLGAMTAAVVVGLIVAGLGSCGTMAVLWLLSFRERPKVDAGVSPLRDGR